MATPTADLDPTALKAVRAKFIEQGLARTTINQQVGRIRRVFRWAGAEGLVPADVASAASR